MTEYPVIRMGEPGINYRVSITDGTLHGVACVSGKAMKQAHANGPGACFSIVAMEVMGVVQALQSRQRNRPEVGGRARLRGTTDEPRSICWINRHMNTLQFADGVDHAWSACEYT